MYRQFFSYNRDKMVLINYNKFTEHVTLGWWLSFAFLLTQSIVISMFKLPMLPIIGIIAFATFVVLSLSNNYDKNYEFSPYKGLCKNSNIKIINIKRKP